MFTFLIYFEIFLVTPSRKSKNIELKSKSPFSGMNVFKILPGPKYTLVLLAMLLKASI
jgi:hypothetical protein